MTTVELAAATVEITHRNMCLYAEAKMHPERFATGRQYEEFMAGAEAAWQRYMDARRDLASLT